MKVDPSGEPGHQDAAPKAPAVVTRELLGRSSVYTAATAVQLAGGVLIYPLLTRALAPAQLGIVSAATLALRFVTVLAAAGLVAAVTRQYFDGTSGPRAARGLVPVVAIVAAAVVLLVDRTGPTWIHIFETLQYEGAIRIAVAAAVPAALLAASQAYLRAAGRVSHFVTVALVSGLGSLALGLLAVLVLGATPENYLWGLLVGDTSACVLALFYVQAVVRPASRDVLTRSLRFGLPTMPHSAALLALGLGDRVVVERLLGLEEVGRYQVAYLLGNLVIAFLIAFNNAWAPAILGAAAENRWQQLAMTRQMITRLASSLIAGVALAAPLLLTLAAPPSYEPSALTSVTAMVALSGLPYVLFQARVIVLFQERRTLPMAVATPVSAAANVGLNLVLIPVLGLPGAAIATVATYSLQALVIGAASRRRAAIPWRQYPIWFPSTAAVGAVLISVVLPTDGNWLWLRGALVLLTVIVFSSLVVRIARPAGPRAHASARQSG